MEISRPPPEGRKRAFRDGAPINVLFGAEAPPARVSISAAQNYNGMEREGVFMQPALLALIGTGGTFLLTALGAAEVYLFGKDLDERIQSMFFGFAAGVMTAASIWSMLLP